MKIGLFFGSFNPVHVGHMIIANHMVEYSDIDQLWFVVSPQNPFKIKKSLLGEYDRLHLVELAIGDNIKMKTCNIEFNLPKPSYTIDTLSVLKEKYPDNEFTLIMGSDNLQTFKRWKNYEIILKHYNIYIYNRPDHLEGDLFMHPKVKLFDTPLLNISSSYIRKNIQDKKSVNFLVPENVFDYMQKINAYK